MRLLSFYLPVLISLYFTLAEGKSRSTSSPYGWRFSPSPWRFHPPSQEYGDLSSSPVSYRSSRKVMLKDSMESSSTGRKRDTNYYQQSYSSSTDCEIICDGGVCVPKDYRCDGYAQCYDGTDEKGCSCAKIVPSEKVCDGYKDCPDGEDEVGCVYGCSSNEFTCDAYNTGSKAKCISSLKRCDGYEDCPNGRDEHDCFRMVDLTENTRGVRSHGILQKRNNDVWYTICKTSSSAKYVSAFAEKACKHINGQLNGSPKVSAVSVSNFKNQMSKQQKENLKYIRLAEIESSFATLASCSTDMVYEVQCPTPKCGGMGSGRGSSDSSYRRRRRRSNLKRKVNEDLSFSDFDSLGDEETEDDAEELEEDEEEGELIVGGSSTQEMQWPFLVGIFRDGEFYCGGSIINDRWILTAAHCNHGYEKHTFEVQAGMTRRYSWSPYEQTRHVEEVYVHEGYDQKIFANDIALYKLDKPLYFSKYVTPACLPSGVEDDPKSGQLCKVAGWGDLHESGSGPDHMQEVSLPVLNRCLETFTRDTHQICAGVLEGGKDACQGDSGGPLMCLTSDGRPVVNGVVSFGRGCARENEAGAYTRVSAYLDWIEGVINGENSYSSNNPRPKQCSERCHKPGGECLYPEEICTGKVDCLGGEDEVGCPSYISRSFMHSSAPSTQTQAYYPPYQNMPQQQPSYYPQYGYQRSSSSKGRSGSNGIRGRTRDVKSDVRKTVTECFAEEVECAAVESNGLKECIARENVCNMDPNCSDKSDELDCLALTNDFKDIQSTFGESEEINGYVMTRNEGLEWHPLALSSWTLDVGQAVCDSVSPTTVTHLKSMETIGLNELSKRLKSGVNLKESTVLSSSSTSNVVALSGMIAGTQSSDLAGTSKTFKKINLNDENVNVNTDELVLGFVRCQPVV